MRHLMKSFDVWLSSGLTVARSSFTLFYGQPTTIKIINFYEKSKDILIICDEKKV